MTISKSRKENVNKSRKQAQNPHHGPIKSLEKLASEYDAEHGKT